jgi:hypothetical protein
MPNRTFLRKWFVRVTVPCVGLAVIACVALYGGARLFQGKLETLSERIKSLRVGVSTLEDVNEIAKDYHDDVVESNLCPSGNCGFTIRLRNTHFPAFYDAPFMWRIGIRPTYAAAVLRVDSGKLRYASFGFMTRTQYGYWLEGMFNAAPALSTYDKCSSIFLGRASTYAVSGAHLSNGDGGGWIIRTAYGAQASSEERRQATTLNLSCIIARPGCRETSDLMPEAHGNLSFEPNRDESFKQECEDYVTKTEVGPGPWTVQSAFEPDPISLTTWSLTR